MDLEMTFGFDSEADATIARNWILRTFTGDLDIEVSDVLGCANGGASLEIMTTNAWIAKRIIDEMAR